MKLDSAVFYTNNLDRAVAFYRDIVGLKVDYIQKGRFASFKLESVKLGIKKAVEKREIPGNQTVFIEVDNIKKIDDQFKSKKVIFLKELVTEDWATNFSILDPDGNKLQFIKK